MNYKYGYAQRTLRLFSLYASLILLAGCGGGSGGSSGGGVSDSGSGSSDLVSTSSEVPENLISFEDPSVTVDAANQGLDLDFDLFRTQFFCYTDFDENFELNIDLTEPSAVFEFTGNTFTLQGKQVNGIITGTIRDTDNTNSVFLTVDGEEDEVRFSINFDSFGQYINSRDFPGEACYQQGASHERALHQYFLNTPEQAVYSCLVADGDTLVSQDLPLTLGGNNQYTFNNESGTYSYQGIFEDSFSSISFSSGSLAGWSGEYTEIPNNGRQIIGIALNDSNFAALCERVREPQPFKRYGVRVVDAPPPSSSPLSGVFFLDVQNSPAVGWLEATADGFLTTSDPLPGGTNCRRVQPNGLERCVQYVYNGGNTISGTSNNQPLISSFIRNTDGSFFLESSRYLPVRTPSPAELAGQWQFQSSTVQDNNDIALCISGICGPSGTSTRTFEFDAEGQFRIISQGSANVFVNGPAGSLSTTTSSNASQSGTYQFSGPSIVLQYFSGQIDPPVYVHLKDDNTLVIDRVAYERL